MLHRFTTCLLADSVGMFWLITGFYLLDNSDYKKLWIGTLKKVVIPGVLMVVFTQFMTDPVINGIPFSQSEALTNEAVRGFFITIVTFRETSVYWYVFAYILITAIQPLLRLIRSILDKSVFLEAGFVILTFALLLINDINDNSILHFSYTGIFVLIPASIEVIWGHIIFRHRELFLRPVVVIFELIIFIATVVIRYDFYNFCLENEMSSHIISWFTSFGFLMALMATLICMQIIREGKEYSFEDAIRMPAAYTYPVYLIHPFLLAYARTRGMFKVMDEWLCRIFSAGVADIIAVIIAFMVFYLLSLGVAVLLRKLISVKKIKKA